MKRHLYTPLTTLALLGLFAYPPSIQAQDTTRIDIALHSDTALEEKGREQLQRIVADYDLDPWIFTQKVVIQSRVIPHSHPVLTLNTQYVDDDVRQLSTFLHEQIHWLADADTIATERVIGEFRQRYPEVPVGEGRGARSEFSTYLHLAVCWLELDAMIRLVGQEQARQLLSEKTHYTWIYEQVLEEGEAIGEILKRHNLIIRPED